MNQTNDYIQELHNREMTLRDRILTSPQAYKTKLAYGEDYFQEEFRSMGLRMIRDGLAKEGEQFILKYTEKNYPDYIDDEIKWIGKMMNYLRAITDTLIDNLQAEKYIMLQGNIAMPSENIIFYPLKRLNRESTRYLSAGFNNLIDITQPENIINLQGWLYYDGEKEEEENLDANLIR